MVNKSCPYGYPHTQTSVRGYYSCFMMSASREVSSQKVELVSGLIDRAENFSQCHLFHLKVLENKRKCDVLIMTFMVPRFMAEPV